MVGGTTAERISFFLPNLQPGGAERVFVTLANHFAGLTKVDLVLCNSQGALLTEVSPQVQLVDLGARNEYYSLIPLMKYLNQNSPDVLLSTLDLSSIIAVLAKKLSNSQTGLIIRLASTISIQERSRAKKKTEQFLMKRLFPYANAIVAVSQGVAQDFMEYTGNAGDKIRVIYNPAVSQKLFEQAEMPVTHPWLVEHDLPVILAVGRLARAKNYPLLVRAFAALQPDIPSRLLILGEGDERSHIEDLARSLGVIDRVEMPGFDPNPFASMKKADCFVLSSDYEGLPNVLIQAMACGCPVISTDCPSGPREILAGGQYGHLVPVGDEGSLLEAMRRSLGGDRRKPPETWMRQFELDHVAEQYWRLIQNIRE